MSSGERLLAPSALLSSRWSRDNLVTPEMARLYTGAVTQRIDVERLEGCLAELHRRFGPIEVEDGSLGVSSWNLRCTRRGERSLLLLPLALDAKGVGGRSKQEVPRRAFEQARHFQARGLSRYLLPARDLWQLSAGLVAARFLLPSGYFPLTFALGSARVDVVRGERASVVSLGARATAEVTRELLTALAYHYDAEDGSAITDVLVNDGDFIVRRADDGAFDVRLLCARYREQGVPPERFLLYLIQLMAYEDWNVADELIGLPVPIANPDLAFSAFVRGQGLRACDCGRGREAGEEAAREQIAAFGRGRDTRAYLPWAEAFLAGKMAPPGDDPRRPWWNLTELWQRRDLARLRDGAAAARPLGELIRGLEQAIGVGTFDAGNVLLEANQGTLRLSATKSPAALLVNDLDRPGVFELLAALGIHEGAVDERAAAWFGSWPFVDPDDVARVLPELVKSGASLDCAATPGELDGSLALLDRLPTRRPARALANPEIYGKARLKGALAAALAAELPSFEGYMDDVLHDPRFGYYARRVVIGQGGHFSTHPEDLTPHYGRWVATWAFELHRSLVQSGRLDQAAAFAVVEFGAGNGRLARDFIDAVQRRAESDPAWREFEQRCVYRIYELSETLRGKQRALLGQDVVVLPGDARNAKECLRRDFPAGVTGLVLSNELPDAFGVHKVLLSADGEAEAVLVQPSLALAALANLPGDLAERCRRSDGRLRALVPSGSSGILLDHATWREVMAQLAALADDEAARGLDEVWFEELLVPVAVLPRLAAVLHVGAAEYAEALAREPSGVVVYVNVHAVDFVREVAQALGLGQILTIDYGDTTAGLVHAARIGQFPFRIYRDEDAYQPRPNDPYACPGGQDLTADVNFTDLALAGCAAGLSVDYFGPERAISGADLPLVLASSDQPPFAKFAGNRVFKVLALGNEAPFAPAAPGLEPLPLFGEPPSSEAAFRARALTIHERLLLGCDSVLRSK